jgi:hypothetical protein
MLTPHRRQLKIELRGDLAGILALSKSGEVKMVAGAGFVQERTMRELRKVV